jgi:hypothetical protein
VTGYVREHALTIALLIVAVVIAVALITKPVPQAASDRPTTPAQGAQKYPGCSFDGDFTNDKPGACPGSTKP